MTYKIEDFPVGTKVVLKYGDVEEEDVVTGTRRSDDGARFFNVDLFKSSSVQPNWEGTKFVRIVKPYGNGDLVRITNGESLIEGRVTDDVWLADGNFYIVGRLNDGWKLEVLEKFVEPIKEPTEPGSIVLVNVLFKKQKAVLLENGCWQFLGGKEDWKWSTLDVVEVLRTGI